MVKFKWFGIISLCCLLVCGGLLYYFLIVRFKESLRYLVTKESKGKYAFDASEANISLRNRTILLRGAELRCVDTSGADTWYHLRIPELRFSLTSWKDLLLHKKIVLDSLSIIEPAIGIHVRKLLQPKDPPDFHASDIMQHLEKTLAHFNVHRFSLKDASFDYELLDGPAPLHADHISLDVSNFTKVNNEDSHLLGSDMVAVRMGRQHWVLPDGRQEINFNRLTFDSRDQRFQLDSFSYYQKDTIGKGAIILYADKFFFNARHLPAIYQKEQLLLDTLTCINPILSIPAYSAGNEKKNTPKKARFKNDLFKLINIKFVSVKDGELLLEDKNGRTENAATRKANLSIFNLSFNPADTPAIRSDSIRINLKNIAFITKDSLYQLSIDEFAFHQHDADFRNVRFAPRQPGHSNKEVVFTAPALLLKDISIVDLLQRRLKASEGELRHPLIVLYDHGGSHPAAARFSPRKRALFYQTLHHVSELIDTRDFNITDGNIRFEKTEALSSRAGAGSLDASVEGLDAHILLNKFFDSDSLVDIKHAIPDLRIGELKLASKGTLIQVDRFRFDGVNRHSRGEQFGITTPGGTAIRGKNIYWNIFDWDIFQKTQDIQIDSLHADELTILQHPGAVAGKSEPSPGQSDLPVIRIGRLDIGKTAYDGQWKGVVVHFTVDRLQASDLHTSRRAFTWNTLRIDLHDIGFEGGNIKTRIGLLTFDSDHGGLIRDLVFTSGNGGSDIQLSAPLIRLDATLHSADPADLAVRSLTADDVALSWSKVVKNDTLKLNAPRTSLHLSDISLIKDGKGRWGFSSAVDGAWKDGSLTWHTDTRWLEANGLSGLFRDKALRVGAGSTPALRQLIAATTIRLAGAHFKDHSITADANGLSWDPSGNVLHCGSFAITPNDSREATFRKAQWQGDYIFLSGRSLDLKDLQFGRDSVLRIRNVLLDGIALDASRDKRMPFRHGIEKPMPTKLINALRLPLRIDTITLRDCSVGYNELSVATGKWSSVPVKAIDGDIINFGNKDHRGDTLRVSARALFFDGHIRHFSYSESYGDPLSGFSAGSYISDIDLTRFSAVSIPAAAVSITGGHADTVFSHWEGNKYATSGTMHFYYNNLRIKVLNKEDMNKGGLMPALKTWVANLILPNKRKKASAIYMERDREKFVFNYWVKAETSGLLSTLGVRKSSKYLKAYMKKQKEFSLPLKKPEEWAK